MVYGHRRMRRGLGGAQPDESSMAQSLDRGHIPFEEVIALLNQRNIPPQLRQVPYVALQQPANSPVLLIPSNPNRMSFIISTPGPPSETDTANYLFSYGFPLKDNLGNFIGIPISQNVSGLFQEGNGTVSIDDLYVFANNLTDATLANFIGYEGVLAVESHLHNQTGSHK